MIIFAFVSFGSVLRNVNLLIVVSGMMFAAMILNWRSAIHRMRSLQAERVLPTRIFANSLTSIVWRCTNHHPSHAAFSVNIEDRIDPATTHPQQEITSELGFFGRIGQKMSDSINRLRRVGPHQVRVNYRRLPPAATHSTVYQTWFEKRGHYQTGCGEIVTTFPFGLIEVRILLDQQTSVYVAPAKGTLSPSWDKRANAMLTGSDSSERKRGTEEDQFFALRKWQSGDERKQIHWRSTARTGMPMVKQFDQPSDRDMAIVIDLFQDDLISDDSIETLLSFAVTAAVQLGQSLHGNMSISLCGHQCETFRHLAQPETNLKMLKAAAIAASSPDPDLFQGIKNAGRAVAAGTPVFVVSTRSEPSWVRQLQGSVGSAFDPQQNEIFRSLALPDAAMGRLTEQIRWLDIHSPIFESMFSTDLKREASLEKFCQRWAS